MLESIEGTTRVFYTSFILKTWHIVLSTKRAVDILFLSSSETISNRPNYTANQALRKTASDSRIEKWFQKERLYALTINLSQDKGFLSN